MLTQTQALEFTRTIHATPAEVFRAFTKSFALRDWLCDAAEADGRVGGRIYLWWNDGYYAAGSYTELQPGAGLAYTWAGPGEAGPSTVRVTLTAEDDSTRVTVTH